MQKIILNSFINDNSSSHTTYYSMIFAATKCRHFQITNKPTMADIDELRGDGIKR